MERCHKENLTMEDFISILEEVSKEGINLHFHQCNFYFGEKQPDKNTCNEDIERSEETSENLEDEVPLKDPINPGTIYLVHEREFIRLEENTYKIGRTSQKGLLRFNGYPKKSELYLNIPSNDVIEDEKNIKKLFKEKYKQQTLYGEEYFSGDVDSMIEDIENYLVSANAGFRTNIERPNRHSYTRSEQNIINFVEHIKTDKPDWYVPGKFMAKSLFAKMYNDKYKDDRSVRSISTFLKKIGLNKEIMGEEKNVKMNLSKYGLSGKTFAAFRAL